MPWRDRIAIHHAHFQLNQISTKQLLEHSVEQKKYDLLQNETWSIVNYL